MPQVLRKLFKALGVCVAGFVILAALGVGAFRIVVAELPSYQGQIQAWAEDVLGLGVGFSRLDARWGLRGPELTFYDASVARRDEAGEPIIRAAAVTFGLSPRTLLLERRIAVCRRAYDLLTQQAGLAPEDIIFDPNIFAVATGQRVIAREAAQIAAHIGQCHDVRGLGAPDAHDAGHPIPIGVAAGEGQGREVDSDALFLRWDIMARVALPALDQVPGGRRRGGR